MVKDSTKRKILENLEIEYPPYQHLQYENHHIFMCPYYIYINDETDFGLPLKGDGDPKKWYEFADEYKNGVRNMYLCDIDKEKLTEHRKSFRKNYIKDYPYVIQCGKGRIGVNPLYLIDCIKLVDSNRLFVDRNSFSVATEGIYKRVLRFYSDDYKQTICLLPVNLYKVMYDKPNQVTTEFISEWDV